MCNDIISKTKTLGGAEHTVIKTASVGNTFSSARNKISAKERTRNLENV
jgi:hypothetical protein